MIPVPTSRDRAARTMAITVVAWATYRVVLVTGFMLSGLAPVTGDPAIDPLVERYSTLIGRTPGAGVVGYFGVPETEPRRQMLARYALAPLLLATTDAHDVVLVDLESDAALEDYVSMVRAKVLTHPRPGLAMVERPRPAP